MSDWDKLWYDSDKRTNYLTHEWLKQVKEEGDKISTRLENVKTAMNKILKPIDEQTGPSNVSQIVIHSVVSALLKIAEGIKE